MKTGSLMCSPCSRNLYSNSNARLQNALNQLLEIRGSRGSRDMRTILERSSAGRAPIRRDGGARFHRATMPDGVKVCNGCAQLPGAAF